MDIFIYTLVAILVIVPLINASVAVYDNMKASKGELVKPSTLGNVTAIVTTVVAIFVIGGMDALKLPVYMAVVAFLQIIPSLSNLLAGTVTIPLWANIIALVAHVLGSGYGLYQLSTY